MRIILNPINRANKFFDILVNHTTRSAPLPTDGVVNGMKRDTQIPISRLLYTHTKHRRLIMETITFKVAMDKEQAALKNTHTVTINVERPADIPDIIWSHAVANYKVKLQGQIRPNWDKFITDTFPKTLAFGETLYAKAQPVAKITTESASKWLEEGTPLDQIKRKITMIEQMGLDVPEHMLEELARLEIASA